MGVQKLQSRLKTGEQPDVVGARALLEYWDVIAPFYGDVLARPDVSLSGEVVTWHLGADYHGPGTDELAEEARRKISEVTQRLDEVIDRMHFIQGGPKKAGSYGCSTEDYAAIADLFPKTEHRPSSVGVVMVPCSALDDVLEILEKAKEAVRRREIRTSSVVDTAAGPRVIDWGLQDIYVPVTPPPPPFSIPEVGIQGRPETVVETEPPDDGIPPGPTPEVLPPSAGSRRRWRRRYMIAPIALLAILAAAWLLGRSACRGESVPYVNHDALLLGEHPQLLRPGRWNRAAYQPREESIGGEQLGIVAHPKLAQELFELVTVPELAVPVRYEYHDASLLAEELGRRSGSDIGSSGEGTSTPPKEGGGSGAKVEFPVGVIGPAEGFSFATEDPTPLEASVHWSLPDSVFVHETRPGGAHRVDLFIDPKSTKLPILGEIGDSEFRIDPGKAFVSRYKDYNKADIPVESSPDSNVYYHIRCTGLRGYYWVGVELDAPELREGLEMSATSPAGLPESWRRIDAPITLKAGDESRHFYYYIVEMNRDELTKYGNREITFHLRNDKGEDCSFRRVLRPGGAPKLEESP